MIYLGVDGGASRTRAAALLPDGSLRHAEGPGSSPEWMGFDHALATLCSVVAEVLEGSPPSEAVHAAFALAGLDTAQDIAILRARLRDAYPMWTLRVGNDAEAALLAGAPDAGPAVVVLSGTGANAGGRRADGSFFTLRGKGYEQGNFGGGLDLIREAVRAAFRSEEGSGPKTRLEEIVLDLSGRASYDELAAALTSDPQTLFPLVGTLPPHVFALAREGEATSVAIVRGMGTALSDIAVAGARKAGLGREDVFPLVMAGGLLEARHPLLEDALILGLHRSFPMAHPRPLPRPPVMGALLMALASGNEIHPGLKALILKQAF